MNRVTFQTVNNKHGEDVYILDAHSGANGYYCKGCNSEMIACFGIVQTPHFRHLASVAVAKECTWSDETHRHKLAKDILQITKSIFVPPVKIPIPKEYRRGEEIEYVIIQEAKTIQAHKVLIERHVFLDVEGNIRLSRDEGFPGNLICIRPDVIFLDNHGKIILLIEICATHKIDSEKLAKLKTIGIDTVEVKIPPVPRKEDINEIFKKNNFTTWLYNYEKANTIFDPYTHKLRRKSPGTVLGPGYIPDREDVSCRAFRLRNIIRQLEAYLASSEFSERRAAINSKLGEIESVTDEIKQRTAGIITDYREAQRKLGDETNKARGVAQERLKGERLLEEQAESEFTSMEERYLLKRRLIEEDESEHFRALAEEEAELNRELAQRKRSYINFIRRLETKHKFRIRILKAKINNTTVRINNFGSEGAGIRRNNQNLANQQREHRDRRARIEGEIRLLLGELEDFRSKEDNFKESISGIAAEEKAIESEQSKINSRRATLGRAYEEMSILKKRLIDITYDRRK